MSTAPLPPPRSLRDKKLVLGLRVCFLRTGSARLRFLQSGLRRTELRDWYAELWMADLAQQALDERIAAYSRYGRPRRVTMIRQSRLVEWMQKICGAAGGLCVEQMRRRGSAAVVVVPRLVRLRDGWLEDMSPEALEEAARRGHVNVLSAMLREVQQCLTRTEELRVHAPVLFRHGHKGIDPTEEWSWLQLCVQCVRWSVWLRWEEGVKQFVALAQDVVALHGDTHMRRLAPFDLFLATIQCDRDSIRTAVEQRGLSTWAQRFASTALAKPEFLARDIGMCSLPAVETLLARDTVALEQDHLREGLAVAMALGNDSVAAYLQQRQSPLRAEDVPRRAFMLALAQDNVEGMRALLALDARDPIPHTDSAGRLLFAALKQGNPHMVQLLLDRFRIDHDALLRNRVHMMAAARSAEVVTTLLRRFDDERTATVLLHAAVCADRLGVVELLLDRGVRYVTDMDRIQREVIPGTLHIAQIGQIETMLRARDGSPLRSSLAHMVPTALLRSCFNLLRWLHGQLPEMVTPLITWRTMAPRWSATLPAHRLRWMHTVTGRLPELISLPHAAMAGFYNCVEWMTKQMSDDQQGVAAASWGDDTPALVFTPCNEEQMDYVARNGHTEVLEYLYKTRSTVGHAMCSSERGIHDAEMRGHDTVVAFLNGFNTP